MYLRSDFLLAILCLSLLRRLYVIRFTTPPSPVPPMTTDRVHLIEQHALPRLRRRRRRLQQQRFRRLTVASVSQRMYLALLLAWPPFFLGSSSTRTHLLRLQRQALLLFEQHFFNDTNTLQNDTVPDSSWIDWRRLMSPPAISRNS